MRKRHEVKKSIGSSIWQIIYTLSANEYRENQLKFPELLKGTNRTKEQFGGELGALRRRIVKLEEISAKLHALLTWASLRNIFFDKQMSQKLEER